MTDGVIAPEARIIISAADSYTEFSPSGTGIHILCKGELPNDRKFSELGVEMYSGGRFFTITGDIVPGCKRAIEERKDELLKLFEEVKQAEEEKEGRAKHTWQDKKEQRQRRHSSLFTKADGRNHIRRNQKRTLRYATSSPFGQAKMPDRWMRYSGSPGSCAPNGTRNILVTVGRMGKALLRRPFVMSKTSLKRQDLEREETYPRRDHHSRLRRDDQRVSTRPAGESLYRFAV